MKRITALLCIASMTVLMTACAEKGTDYSNQTLTGKVTAVDGTKVTMRLGELSEQETPQKEEAAEGSQGETLAAKGEGNGESDGQSPPEMTSGEAPTDNAEGDAPPEKQSGAEKARLRRRCRLGAEKARLRRRCRLETGRDALGKKRV